MIIIYLILSVLLIIFLSTRLNVHPFLALTLVAILYGLVVGMPIETIISSINEGFGKTLGHIGLIIVLGVIIGAFLENTGAAYALAEKVLKVVGKKKVPLAMGIIGYFVSIPVFADSGFVLLSPLNRSLSKKAGISLSGSAIALALGLMATHTMVPPTPGPIAAAGLLNADLGLVLMIGIPVSAIALTVCIIFATKYVAKTYIDPNPEVDATEVSNKTEHAPGVALSTLPVVIPIVLIVIKSFAKTYEKGMSPVVHDIIWFMGEPIIALIIGMFLALLLPKKLDKQMLSTTGWVGKALKDSATIILITGAGGIFGTILQNSGIADTLGDILRSVNLSIWLPFILAAAIKTAQGSSTVSLITTASIMAPMLGTLGFDTELEKALIVLTIGAGSAVASHANDSFFWVVTQMSGMDTKMGYRMHTLGSAVLGFSAALTLFIIYLIFV